MSSTDQPFDSESEATQLVHRAAAGDQAAAAQLLPLVYARLRGLAAVYVRGRPEHTLQATALAHEAYLKMVSGGEGQGISPKDGEHLLAIAARAMRQILTDHARARASLKRGGGQERVPLESVMGSEPESSDDDLLTLDEALDRFARADPRRYRVVELRFLGGLSVAETARVLNVSERTVESDWRAARAWLQGALRGEE